jgi:general nucleoside transport system permease protein
MNYPDLSIVFASIIAGASPIVIATLGETITEKSGIINLSLDGTILLSAMTGFVAAFETGSVLVGFLSAAAIGGFVALIVGVFSIYMGLSQVAVGFVLTLMTRDLAYFLGNAYSRIQGPKVEPLPVRYLKDIPYLGEILFNHYLPVYGSLLLIPLVMWYFDRTTWGLKLKATGENPSAIYARGVSPQRLQLFYTVVGGILVGVGGATFSLLTKPGWGHPQGAEGTGWIVLALVIFGGWGPLRAAVGAYFFSFLQVIGIYFQEWFPEIPAQLFQVAPFPLMIFTLAVVNLTQNDFIVNWVENKNFLKGFLQKISGTQPTSLGKPYVRNGMD